MADGVLLKGADGSHYFIPHADLSRFAVPDPSAEAAEHLEADAPRLDAYHVQEAGEDAPASMAWLAASGEPE